MQDGREMRDRQRSALALRYGSTAIPGAGPWNGVIDGLLAHRTVRGYKPDELPEGTLETMIAAAGSAPSTDATA